jgi:hypothetical protein
MSPRIVIGDRKPLRITRRPKLIQLPLLQYKRAIRATHSAKARLIAREKVYVDFGGDVAWAGEVLVFELLGHPSANLCYAWKGDGQVVSVLGEGPVESGRDAVRAAMMAS